MYNNAMKTADPKKEEHIIMAKHRSSWTSRRYHKLLAEGRGQGTLENYKPWITIHDIASKGVSSRILGYTTGRIHHTLSTLETSFFYLLDASDKVIDIREQYPLLPVDETVSIADRTGIRHPRDQASRYPYVMTTDFVITTQEGIVARSVKQSEELENPRVLEKLEIERRYWERRHVKWRIVTEETIDHQKARNLEWIYRARFYPEMLPEGRDAQEIETFFANLYHGTCLSVADVARQTEERFELSPGLGITTFQYMLLQHQIKIDLSSPLDLVSKRTGKGGAHSWLEMYV